MKVKNKFRFLLTPAIYFLTFTSIYGQEANRNDTASSNALIINDTAHAKLDSAIRGDTMKMPYLFVPISRFLIDTTAIDTTRIPYLSAKGIPFSDSLKEALKNSLSTLFEKNETAKTSIPTFFTSKQPKYSENLPREKQPFDWFFAALLLFLSILAVLRLLIPNLFSVVLHKKSQKDLFQRTDNLSKNWLRFLLTAASWIGFSLALREALSLGKFLFPFEPFLFSSVIVLVYFLSKYLLKKILGWIFQIEGIISEHLSIAAKTNFAWSLIAFFLVIINHYAANDYLIWVICLVFCINFLQKSVWEWIIFSQKLRFFEILLYLCTIEILPLLLFTKYVMNYF
jgi:hypothetical protein